MRKYFCFFLMYALLGLCIVSCNFTEEMTIQPDGSGKIAINFDGSSLMEMMGDELKEDGKEEKMDSIFDFTSLLEERKDSISQLSQEKQDKLKRLENFKMRIQMDTEAKAMNFSMFSDFKNVNELSDMMSTFEDATSVQELNGQSLSGNKSPMGSGSQGTDVSYRFENNKFSRSTVIVDPTLFEKSKDSLEEIAMFMSESTYTLKYTFSKKIKKISAEDALFSQDGKTFTLAVSFLDMIKNPKILDLELELED